MNKIRIEAPARLHWGMFDLGGSLGRRFGGIGATIGQPSVILEAEIAPTLTAEGPAADRVVAFADRYLHANQITTGAHFRVEQTIPAHVGLGSGTKLGMAVAQALATLYDLSDDPYLLAQAVGRGSRSAIGLWTFAQGGFVVEGGQWPEQNTPAPLLLRQAMPADWHCVLAIPETSSGLSGDEEAKAFAQLGGMREQAAAISHLVLMSLLPALVEGELAEFGAALTQMQRLVGECFSPVQGGHFANDSSARLIELMLAKGAAGAGQSSWGPAVYGLVGDLADGQRLAAQVADFLDGQGSVAVVPFDNRGVTIQNL